MPILYSQSHIVDQTPYTPTSSTQLSSKEEIASYLSREKAKQHVLSAVTNPSIHENNPRRFSTVGPLGRNCASSVPSCELKSKFRAAQRAPGNAAKAIKRPVSRTLKQVQRTILHEDSREGTRLEASSRGPGSLQVADVISQVESRLSTRRPF